MNSLRRSFGTVLSSVILALVTVWVIGMIIGPQAIMLENSLWNRGLSSNAVQISLKVSRLYNDVTLLGFDKSDAQDLKPSAEQTALITGIEAKIAAKKQEIPKLQLSESKPKKIYSLRNYTLMSPSDIFILLKTIIAAVAVTLIAVVVCYPIAFAVAKVVTPRKAAMIMLLLIVPYSINELLRIFAWLMILDYRGVANLVLGVFGFGPVHFLDSGAGVFIALVYAYVLFMVFPIYNTMETLDTAQIEAARDLGAPTWQIHRKIVIPHAKPGIAVGCIMTFMLAAGSYAVPSIMTRGKAEPWFTQLIYNKFFESGNWNTGSAYAFILVVICVVFIFLVMRLFGIGIRDIAK